MSDNISAASRLPLPSAIDQVVDRALAAKRMVGAVIVVAESGKVIYRRAAGYADREAGVPMADHAVFRLASMSKPITTVAALVLVEQGILSLDDPAAKWLPNFRPQLPDGRELRLTLRHLLTHTAGLSYGFLESADGPYHKANVSDGLDQPGLSAAENLRRIARVPLHYFPGDQWRYSVATDIVGEIVGAAAQSPFPEAVRRLVTEPLAMADTDFTPGDPARMVTPYANGTPEPVRMGDNHLVPNGVGEGFRFSPSRVWDPRSFPSGGAGMVGTAADYLAFLETLRQGGGKLLSPAMVKRMMANQVGTLAEPENGPGWGFGFGGAVLYDPVAGLTPQSVGTFQWGGAYGHTWWIDPARELTVVLLTNTTPEGMGGQFTLDIRDAIYASR